MDPALSPGGTRSAVPIGRAGPGRAWPGRLGSLRPIRGICWGAWLGSGRPGSARAAAPPPTRGVPGGPGGGRLPETAAISHPDGHWARIAGRRGARLSKPEGGGPPARRRPADGPGARPPSRRGPGCGEGPARARLRPGPAQRDRAESPGRPATATITGMMARLAGLHGSARPGPPPTFGLTRPGRSDSGTSRAGPARPPAGAAADAPSVMRRPAGSEIQRRGARSLAGRPSSRRRTTLGVAVLPPHQATVTSRPCGLPMSSGGAGAVHLCRGKQGTGGAGVRAANRWKTVERSVRA